MEISHEAFREGEFDVAYHSLGASLHCSICESDSMGLSLIKGEAQRQLAWIDRHAPSVSTPLPPPPRAAIRASTSSRRGKRPNKQNCWNKVTWRSIRTLASGPKQP